MCTLDMLSMYPQAVNCSMVLPRPSSLPPFLPLSSPSPPGVYRIASDIFALGVLFLELLFGQMKPRDRSFKLHAPAPPPLPRNLPSSPLYAHFDADWETNLEPHTTGSSIVKNMPGHVPYVQVGGERWCTIEV